MLNILVVNNTDTKNYNNNWYYETTDEKENISYLEDGRIRTNRSYISNLPYKQIKNVKSIYDIIPYHCHYLIPGNGYVLPLTSKHHKFKTIINLINNQPHNKEYEFFYVPPRLQSGRSRQFTDRLYLNIPTTITPKLLGDLVSKDRYLQELIENFDYVPRMLPPRQYIKYLKQNKTSTVLPNPMNKNSKQQFIPLPKIRYTSDTDPHYLSHNHECQILSHVTNNTLPYETNGKNRSFLKILPQKNPTQEILKTISTKKTNIELL